MKTLIPLLCLFALQSSFANDYVVKCSPWEDSKLNFSLEAEVELAGGNYTDAWVTMKVFESGQTVQSINSVFSYGAFFIDRLEGKRVLIFELRPAGGQSYKYDFLSLAANHPIPTGNSYLTYKGKQYQAECVVND
ncbi:MAG: hypothetical protein CME70_11685 [Halobacteriovorax sp.]|nr:hypothetical protein [Halobacteriovorax sp.]|tara:strand:+ start:21626 stop:22030 length:405 start_codon:yes stop_codon:yes gene_type:complete